MLHSNSHLVGQISGGLAYSVRNLEGRFLRFQVSCPGEDVGCLPFKIQGRAADVPGNDSMTCTSRPVFFSGGCGSLHMYIVCVYVFCLPVFCVMTITTSFVSPPVDECLDCQGNFRFLQHIGKRIVFISVCTSSLWNVFAILYICSNSSVSTALCQWQSNQSYQQSPAVQWYR